MISSDKFIYIDRSLTPCFPRLPLTYPFTSPPPLPTMTAPLFVPVSLMTVSSHVTPPPLFVPVSLMKVSSHVTPASRDCRKQCPCVPVGVVCYTSSRQFFTNIVCDCFVGNPHPNSPFAHPLAVLELAGSGRRCAHRLSSPLSHGL